MVQLTLFGGSDLALCSEAVETPRNEQGNKIAVCPMSIHDWAYWLDKRAGVPLSERITIYPEPVGVEDVDEITWF